MDLLQTERVEQKTSSKLWSEAKSLIDNYPQIWIDAGSINSSNPSYAAWGPLIKFKCQQFCPIFSNNWLMKAYLYLVSIPLTPTLVTTVHLQCHV